MIDWIEALLLGVIQGLTEFLPVSSDGHLAVTQQAFAKWKGASRAAGEDFFFDVMLHLGTLVAILVYYRGALRRGARGFIGKTDELGPEHSRTALMRLGGLVFVATLPLVPDALFLKDYLEAAFQSPVASAAGFLFTAAVLLVTTWLKGGTKGPRETTWVDALIIGTAQAFAPLPGVSRSGLTIAAALSRGLERTWAVGFSLMIAVPAILGAVVFQLRELSLDQVTSERLTRVIVATILAGLVGYGAITWLVRVVRHGRLWYFSVYLIVLAIVVLAVLR